MNNADAWNVGWEGLGALATAAAVLVALFGPPIAAWWRRPRLELVYEDEAPFRRLGSPGPKREWTDELWLRAQVRHRRGRSEARGVQTVATRMSLLSSGTTSRGAVGDMFDPVTLWWSGRQDGEPLTLRRNEAKLVDVAKLQQFMGPEANMQLVTGEAAVKGQANNYLAGVYEIEVSVFAENSSSISRRFTIELEDQVLRSRASIR